MVSKVPLEKKTMKKTSFCPKKDTVGVGCSADKVLFLSSLLKVQLKRRAYAFKFLHIELP